MNRGGFVVALVAVGGALVLVLAGVFGHNLVMVTVGLFVLIGMLIGMSVMQM